MRVMKYGTQEAKAALTRSRDSMDIAKDVLSVFITDFGKFGEVHLSGSPIMECRKGWEKDTLKVCTPH